MIAQVLNRDFLQQAATLLHAELERELKEREGSGGSRGAWTEVDELEDGELREVIGELGEATGEPEMLEADPEGGEPSDEGGIRPKDDFAYVPREAMLSLVQTAIDEHVVESDDVEVTTTPMLDDRRGAEEPAVTDLRIADFDLTRTLAGRRKFGDMEVAKFLLFSDPKWLSSGFAMGVRFFRKRVKWKENAPIVPIANKARIIVVGDWGSGIPRAKKVADRIEQVLAEDDSMERHVVHLGDVYYSGSKREYERNFLNLWPVSEWDAEKIGSFSLCGNHDMYYGGHAYYGTLLDDERLARQGKSSFFALKNDHWQLLGLDTGYEDGGLEGDQATWARALIDAAPEHRIALLTHHQLFSSHELGAKKLGKKIEPVLATDRIDAWFWGHEHRCIQYDATEWKGHRVGFSSCLGHGGIPEYLAMEEGETRDPPWAYEYLEPYGTAEEPWEKFGFAVVDLDGPEMKVRYIDEDRVTHHEVDRV